MTHKVIQVFSAKDPTPLILIPVFDKREGQQQLIIKCLLFTQEMRYFLLYLPDQKKLSSPQQREKTAAQALDASTCSWWNANSCFNELEHIGLRLSAKLMISKKSDSVLERLQWQKMNSKTSRLQGCRFPTRAQRQKDQLFFPHSISVTKYFCERHTTGLT